jgi:hypothetical protein
MLALSDEGRVLGAAPFLPLFLQRAGDVYDDAGMRRWLPHGGSWPWLQEGCGSKRWKRQNNDRAVPVWRRAKAR